MSKYYKVTLLMKLDENGPSNPGKWDWFEILDLTYNEEVRIDYIEEIEEEDYEDL